MPSLLKTREQERAFDAWNKVQSIKNITGIQEPEKFKKRYSGLARSMPAMIQTAGLGQSLAFLRARDKGDKGNTPTAEWKFYCHLSSWIEKYNQIANNELLEWLITRTSDEYRQTTTEIIAYLRWLKRFAEAELPEPEGGGDE